MSAATQFPFNAGQSGNELGQARDQRDTTEQDFLNLLGPSGNEMHQDKKRNFRHSRLHIPDRLPEKLLGPNPYMQDRVGELRRPCDILRGRRRLLLLIDFYIASIRWAYHRRNLLAFHDVDPSLPGVYRIQWLGCS